MKDKVKTTLNSLVLLLIGTTHNDGKLLSESLPQWSKDKQLDDYVTISKYMTTERGIIPN
jgi:hypothetical protein